MTQIEKAIQIALDAHKGHVDKGGHAYILHPLRVMYNVDGIEEKIVAVLHDVVEDSNYTFADLEQEGISLNCIEALMLLTHEKHIPYIDYIKRISANSIAKTVKLADLRDNSDSSRLVEITDEDKERLKKYGIAIDFLDNQLTKSE